MKARIAVVGLTAMLLSSCSATQISNTESQEITLHNCGQEAGVEKPGKLWVYDGSIIATTLAAGAGDKIAHVSGIARDREVLEQKYGDAAKRLQEDTEQAPSLEELVARQPDLYFAGWGYGLSAATNVTPEVLKERGIDTYILSESCKQEEGNRGIMNPWDAVNEDLRNIALLAGDPVEADRVITDIEHRRVKLEQAPQAAHKPKVFLFDSGTDSVFTSGKFGGPQAILDAAGAQNATADVADTWTTVGWEKIIEEQPDVIAFVDYPGQSFEEKVKVLKAHPAAKNLPAVQHERFINLPYAMWTSGPMNIDAAEHVRSGLEKFELQPDSDITPELALPSILAGQNHLR